jgi:hypothetical protein
MAQYNARSSRPLKDWVGGGSVLVKLTEEEFKDKIIPVRIQIYLITPKGLFMIEPLL